MRACYWMALMLVHAMNLFAQERTKPPTHAVMPTTAGKQAKGTANNTPIKFRAITGTFFRPNFLVEMEGDSLTYQTLLFPGGEKPLVILDRIRIRPMPEQWKEFRDELDRINIWRWKPKYKMLAPDGSGWEFSVKYSDHQLDSSGDNAYPDDDGQQSGTSGPTPAYLKLIAAVEKLIGGRPFNSAGDTTRYNVMYGLVPRMEFREAECQEVLDFLCRKGTEILRAKSGKEDAVLKFEYRYNTAKVRPVISENWSMVPYSVPFAAVLRHFGLSCEVLAEDRVVITEAPEEMAVKK